jgi:DNA repair exonuclease SbcCD ATPase subunit
MIQLPIRFDFRETFFDRLVNMDPFKDVSDLYQYIDFANFIDDYNNIKKQYDIYLMEYKVYESKSELIDSIINDIEDLSRKTNFLDEEISKNNTFISENSKKLIELEDAYKKIKDISMTIEASYKPSRERIEELESIKSTLDDNTKVINELQNKLNISNTSLGEVTANIKRLSAEKETLNHKIILIEEYKRYLEIYRNKYTKLEKIRYYSSPSTGIQTLFIELYMNKIISIANDLLSMLFNGEFSLQPFIVNEAEFRIPCIGDGLLHDDISSMSTAQKCMISMILSFSILHQSSTKYNIISVDEIDGGLDTYNRTYFTSLLDRLMVMLQCEQCFIISHNDELNTSSADLILLKNDIDYSHQGNVIWKY